MGVKEFWKNRSYLQKGFIIGVLFFFGWLMFSWIVLSRTIVMSFWVSNFIVGPLCFGLFFGFIGFWIGFIKKEERTRIINEIKMKDEGYFLKPNKGKILITFLMVVSTYITIGISCLLFRRTVCYFLSSSNFSSPMILLVYNLPKLSLFTLILLAYTLSCFRIKNKKGWLIGIVLYLVAFISISQGIIYEVDNYNAKYGYSCNTDGDCYCDCHGGFVAGHKFIRLSIWPYFYNVACKSCYGICENNQCVIYDESKVSVDYCERRTEGVKSICYNDLVLKERDIKICDSIEEDDVKLDCKRGFMMEEGDITIEFCKSYSQTRRIDMCLDELARKSNDVNACNEIQNEDAKGWCILFTKDIESIEDCEKMKSSQSWCYSDLAKKLKDFSICERIEADIFREPCISELARSIEDCNKIIKQEYLKKECMRKFQS